MKSKLSNLAHLWPTRWLVAMPYMPCYVMLQRATMLLLIESSKALHGVRSETCD